MKKATIQILLSTMVVTICIITLHFLFLFFCFNFLTLGTKLSGQQLSDYHFYFGLTITAVIVIVSVLVFSLIYLIKGVLKLYSAAEANPKTLSYDKADKNKEQYDNALARIYDLMQTELKENSKQADEFEVLTILVKDYELAHYPVPKPHPIEDIKFRLEQTGI